MHIDLNADLGESFGRWRLGDDEGLMPLVTSANVACGYHAGDPGVMRRTVRLARAAGVSVGAHPGLPDLAGFGRREMALAGGEVEDLVLYQIGALAALARAEGVRLRHVKPHGALYHLAARDPEAASAIARAVSRYDPSLVVFGLPGSELLRAADAMGLPTAAEGFADRAYEPDGSLAPRSRPGAVIDDAGEAVARALRMVREGQVQAADGSDLAIRVDTISVHGDTPGSRELAARLRAAFEAAGVRVRAPGLAGKDA